MANVFELTRTLVDIESITNNEAQVASYVFDYLSKMAARHSGHAERMPVEGARFNVFASWGKPMVTLSTHMDTVPPFFPSREDGESIGGRGSCDAKGILAAMMAAAENLLADGVTNFGLLFVVGEERNSAGSKVAAQSPRGCRFLINGEPTENKLALGSKGVLRFELNAQGRMAHSAYPELGESAIETLLDNLEAIRRIPLPEDSLLGRCTMNIGTISGGRAPNVIPDAAQAEIVLRLVGDAEPLRKAFAAVMRGRAQLKEILSFPAMQFERLDGYPTIVVAYGTDIPFLTPSWGKPLLLGPGSIHLAHTDEERIPKKELSDAVGIYADMVRKLLASA